MRSNTALAQREKLDNRRAKHLSQPMDQRRNMDTTGASALIAFALLLALNQVAIKVVNEGLQPVFFAGLRSAAGALVVWLWIKSRGRSLQLPPGIWVWGLVIGVVFAVEFIALFIALDLTTVTRTSVIFYSMPLWLAVAGHFLIPGEKLHRTKVIGLVLAFLGVAWAILDRRGPDVAQASLIGDIAALVGAWGWAAVALLVRTTPLSKVRPETQNFLQLAVSTPILLLAAPFFGPFIREFETIHIYLFAFQVIAVVSFGFLFWMWLLTIYRAAEVAAFSFLSPLFGIMLGWLILGERAGLPLLFAGGLVAAGLLLINRPAPKPIAI